MTQDVSELCAVSGNTRSDLGLQRGSRKGVHRAPQRKKTQGGGIL